jgi:tetratricopeptide (TPR) repeat protein
MPSGRPAHALLATVLVSAALAAACSTAPPPATRPPARRAPPAEAIVARERAYLLPPFEGYPGSLAPEARARLRDAWAALVEEGDVAAARDAARDLGEAGERPLPPASVLAAQADFADGDFAAVVRRLVAVGDAAPTYTASQLLLGRAAELAGDVPLAYAAYRAVAARSPLAFQRTGELHPRALEIVGNRLRESLKAGRIAEANRHLELLRAWAPDETGTLEAARAVALSRGDLPAELAAVKRLAERRPGDTALLQRRADLELAVGDPGAGLKIVEGLAEHHPGDPALAEKLAAAKFRWRLSLLPQVVRDIAARPELTRADLATLIYWLMPQVRYAKPSGGRIANDVLDHPQRDEIVRVVNLGLLDFDETLHRFSPGSPARRATALRAMVRVLQSFGGGACLGENAGNPQPSQALACDLASRCGVLAPDDDCQPGEALAGGDAVEMIRRTLKLLGRS